MELARGRVSDRPWARTLGTIALRRAAGELVLETAAGQIHRVAFADGNVTGATSPIAGDSPLRLATIHGFITAEQARRLGPVVAGEHGDPIDAIAEACRLDPRRALELRRLVIAHGAARTFSVEHGSFVLDDTVTLPARPGAAVDLRSVVLDGIRANVPDLRLAADLARLGNHFTLRGDAELRPYALAAEHAALLDALRAGASIGALEAKAGVGLDRRTVRAIVYALVGCFACDATHTTMVVPRPAPADEPAPSAFARGSRGGFQPVGRAGDGDDVPVERPGPSAPEAYARGASLLRADRVREAVAELETAVELAPIPDHVAMLEWARFCAARDKQAAAASARAGLSAAIRKDPDAPLARLLLGRLERIVGRDRVALRLFESVLELDPRNADAQTEIRFLQARRR